MEEDTLQTNTNSHPHQTYELTNLPHLTPYTGVRRIRVAYALTSMSKKRLADPMDSAIHMSDVRPLA